MGINEQVVLSAIHQGFIHAPEIAEQTHLSPSLVKACLVSLERHKQIQYRDGYRTEIVQAVKMKPAKKEKKYYRGTVEQKDLIKEALSRGEKTSNELSRITGIVASSLRSCLSLLTRKKVLTATHKGGRGKLYALR